MWRRVMWRRISTRVILVTLVVLAVHTAATHNDNAATAAAVSSFAAGGAMIGKSKMSVEPEDSRVSVFDRVGFGGSNH